MGERWPPPTWSCGSREFLQPRGRPGPHTCKLSAPVCAMEWAPLPGVSGPDHPGTSPGSHQAPGGGGLSGSAPPSAQGFRAGSKAKDGPQEAPALCPPLVDLRRRLVPAFPRAAQRGASGCSWEAGTWEALLELQRRVRVESALAWLRCELLEMCFENHQLTRTLLDLSMKMELLREEYEMEIAAESQSWEANAVDPGSETHT